MRRHLLAFIVLAVAVAAPAVYLLWDTARSYRADLALARAEEHAIHARAADAIRTRIRSQLEGLVREEERRRYFEYNFVHTPLENQTKGQITSNAVQTLTYQVSQLSNDTPINPLINGYVQIDDRGRIEIPQVLNNPSPAPRQVAHLHDFQSRLQNFSKVHQRVLKQTKQQAAPQRREPVPRSTYDANKNSAQWAAQIQKANRGDTKAQQAVQGLNIRQQEAEAQTDEELVEVVYYPFRVFTVDTVAAGVGGDKGDKGKPTIVLLRRIEERERKAPREYFQGFELDLDQLASQTFPQAVAAVPAPNFAARVVRRDAPGDRSLVRDLGPYLPVFELRSWPASPESVEQKVEDRRQRLLITYGVLAAIVGAALLLFWRLLGGEVELGRRRQDFVSAVTHELKTPLTSIRMYAELLEDGWVEEPEKQREYYGIIRGESERLSRLIANVLDFARLERGARGLKRETIDAAATAREALRPLVQQVERAGGRVALEAPDDLPPFPLDRDAFAQILINLVDNAVKYGDHPPQIEIGLSGGVDGLELTVENRGEEIPPRERARIFEEFRRGKGRRSRAVSGVGLGLALVRRFAGAHGGRAECLEPKLRGARFRVTFGPAAGSAEPGNPGEPA